MKLAELFEAYYVDKIVGRTAKLIDTDAPPGVKTSMDLDRPGRDIRINANTNQVTTEPPESDETKMVMGLANQQFVSIQEQPVPADPKVYKIPTEMELYDGWKITVPGGLAQLIRSGFIYILDPDNIRGKPERRSWKGYQVEIVDGQVALGIERGPAEQARVLRQIRGPLGFSG